MNRRDILKAAVALPLIGTVSAPTTAQAYQAPPELSAGEMAEKLLTNYKNGPGANSSPIEDEFVRGVCFRMCEKLLERDDDLSAPYLPDYPNHDHSILKNVRYEVLSAPSSSVIHPDTGETIEVTAKTQKLRTLWNAEPAQDLEALYGGDAVALLLDAVANEIVLEIQLDIQLRPCRVFAMYLPPFAVTPTLMDPKDFTLRRRMGMSCGKVA